jgi:hypothetical protein
MLRTVSRGRVAARPPRVLRMAPGPRRAPTQLGHKQERDKEQAVNINHELLDDHRYCTCMLNGRCRSFVLQLKQSNGHFDTGLQASGLRLRTALASQLSWKFNDGGEVGA